MNSRLAQRKYLLLFAILIFSGCSSSGKPVEVEGIVLLENEPVSDATVLFIPEGGTGQPAHGMTDENGRFQLSTFKENDGALPGSYTVTVTKSVPPPEPPEADPSDSKSVYAHFKAIKEQKKLKSPVPSTYANGMTTPFHFTVPVEGKVVLELKKSEQKEATKKVRGRPR
jgi:hypothetical protein